jgi:hypothetical protein
MEGRGSSNSYLYDGDGGVKSPLPWWERVRERGDVRHAASLTILS